MEEAAITGPCCCPGAAIISPCVCVCFTCSLSEGLICMQRGWEPGQHTSCPRPRRVTMPAPRKGINIYGERAQRNQSISVCLSIYSASHKFNFGGTFGGVSPAPVTARQKCTRLIFDCNWENSCWFFPSVNLGFPPPFQNLTHFNICSNKKNHNNKYFSPHKAFLFLNEEVKRIFSFSQSPETSCAEPGY